MNTLEQHSLLDKRELEFLSKEAIALLKQLIGVSSFSKEENKTANLIEIFLHSKGISSHRKLNNVWAFSRSFNSSKPTILLNSHHDTVKPNAGYTLNPFEAIEKDGKLFGLGSNDAGASLVSLLVVFIYFYEKEGAYNFIFAASAEEEISGVNGIELILPELGKIDVAIVGEPTQMNLAIAEKGLMVLDCKSVGVAGHAAREEGVNAIYKSLRSIDWFKSFQFPKSSKTLGPVKMSVTAIHAGAQHNVVPDVCEFVVDVRTTDVYSNEEVLKIIKEHVDCEVIPRSMRLNSSSISTEHSLVKAGIKLGRKTYGSPTSSDQALMNFPSLKMGPGDSARSHTADEFIYVEEIKEGIELYVEILNRSLGYARDDK
ncbi:M20 family metallo-hydrolase [soil metagenome]